MKAVVASLATAAIVAGGAGAYVKVVTPAQFARLNARVTALESFKQHCLMRIQLSTTTNHGPMVWNQDQLASGPTPYGAVFFGHPYTAPGIC